MGCLSLSLSYTHTHTHTHTYTLAHTHTLPGVLLWALQGVGPSEEAKAAMENAQVREVKELNALLFGSNTPTVAIYCGAKVRRESYAPLALAVIKELQKIRPGSAYGVLVLQSPFNVYAIKPSTVAAVLEKYPR